MGEWKRDRHTPGISYVVSRKLVVPFALACSVSYFLAIRADRLFPNLSCFLEEYFHALLKLYPYSQELGGRFSRIVSCVFLFHGFFTDSSQMFHAHFNSPKSWWDCTASKNRAIRDRQVANDCQAHRHLLGITVAILRPGFPHVSTGNVRRLAMWLWGD